jgi:hypothetical protein
VEAGWWLGRWLGRAWMLREKLVFACCHPALALDRRGGRGPPPACRCRDDAYQLASVPPTADWAHTAMRDPAGLGTVRR